MFDILFKDDQPQKAVPGGSTFNSIVSLGRAGVPCVMVTEVGDDHVGDLICNFLKENGVSTEYVCRHEHVKSHISLAFLDKNNDAQYVFYKDHASVSLDGKLPVIGENDVVLFGSFFAINPVIRPIVGKLLHAAREAGAWLYYDVNFRKNHIADLPEVMANIEENMHLADVVRGSMEDFGFLYGLQDGDAVYDKVSRYCRTLILTDGAQSIRVYTPEGCETYPVQAIETVSTVGLINICVHLGRAVRTADQNRVGTHRVRPHGYGRTHAVCPYSIPQLFGHWRINHTQDGLFVVNQCDVDGEFAVTVHKLNRTIQGVDEPIAFVLRTVIWQVFLADKGQVCGFQYFFDNVVIIIEHLINTESERSQFTLSHT